VGVCSSDEVGGLVADPVLVAVVGGPVRGQYVEPDANPVERPRPFGQAVVGRRVLAEYDQSQSSSVSEVQQRLLVVALDVARVVG